MIRLVEGLSLAGSSQARGGKGARKWEPHAGWGSRTFEASDKVRANRADGIILKTREASHIGKAPQGRGSLGVLGFRGMKCTERIFIKKRKVHTAKGVPGLKCACREMFLWFRGTVTKSQGLLGNIILGCVAFVQASFV